MSTLYFLRQPFVNDPKDTWRVASGRAFDLMPEADRMAVVPAASLADAQAEIARLRGALEKSEKRRIDLDDTIHAIFNAVGYSAVTFKRWFDEQVSPK